MKRIDTKSSARSVWLRILPAMLVLVSACAPMAATTGPETPAPGNAAPPPAEPAGADRPGGAADDAEEPASAADSVAELEARLVEMARAARGPEPELSPIKPFGISWSPEPREGHAFSVRVYERPSGRRPAVIEGEFAGRKVRFARLGANGRWFGIGVVPIGRSDPEVLTLRMQFEDGATYEQSLRIAVDGTTFPSSELRVDPRYSSPPPEVRERIRREREMVREILSTATPEWHPDRPFMAPRPMDVTSPFGQARTFNGELRSRHTGLDLRGRTGAPVHAAGAGRVAFAGELYFAGNAVYIDHGLGVYTGYFHLSRIHVREGNEVEAGRLVGDAGATGRVTGAHLHWYLSVDGEAADASSLLGMRPPD
jgi:hypothetical protein